MSGMQADCREVAKQIEAKLVMYIHQNGHEMSVEAIAQLLSNTLYYKRFFPYYASCMLCGLKKDGSGVIYSYDSIGSFQAQIYGSVGTGSSLVLPLLDNQLGWENQAPDKGGIVPRRSDLPLEDSSALLRDALTSCGERDIYTGDYLDMWSVTKDGITTQKAEINFD